MKKFFNDISDIIIKLVVTQLGMTMFGVMIVLVTRALPGADKRVPDPMWIVASLLATGLYLYLIYVHTWEKGARDKIKIDGGRMELTPLKGLYGSLIANSVNILLGLSMFVVFFFCDFEQVYSMPCQIYGSLNLITRFIQGMYIGFVQFFWQNPLTAPSFVFLLTPLPAIVVSTIGYYFGVSNKGKLKAFEKTTSK